MKTILCILNLFVLTTIASDLSNDLEELKTIYDEFNERSNEAVQYIEGFDNACAERASNYIQTAQSDLVEQYYNDALSSSNTASVEYAIDKLYHHTSNLDELKDHASLCEDPDGEFDFYDYGDDDYY